MRFTATIQIRGINPYVLVSAAHAKKLAASWKKPMPVLVRVDGKPEQPWRINMMPVGDGSFYLYLHGEVRKASRTGVGDRVAIELEFDPAYKGGPQSVPPALSAALRADKIAAQAWRALTPSRQKEIARYLANLKSPAARQRNLVKVLAMLGGKPQRLFGRE